MAIEERERVHAHRRMHRKTGGLLWGLLRGSLSGSRRYFSDASAVELAEGIKGAKWSPHRLREVIGSGLDLNIRGREGMTPLLYALISSRFNAFDALLEAGADPNAKADNGNGVMSAAAIHPDIPVSAIGSETSW
jgi:hypothetical protein